jgi:hypothetical protein
MDEETKLFLKRIAESIGILILWMLLQITFGIYKNYGFFEGTPSWQNIAYYVFFIGTGIALYIHLTKKWKKKD